MSEYAPGEASIDQEFMSDENKYFVLHDSKGFEPANNTNFDHAARFLRERHGNNLLKDRLHAIWQVTISVRLIPDLIFSGSVQRHHERVAEYWKKATRSYWLWHMNLEVRSFKLVPVGHSLTVFQPCISSGGRCLHQVRSATTVEAIRRGGRNGRWYGRRDVTRKEQDEC